MKCVKIPILSVLCISISVLHWAALCSPFVSIYLHFLPFTSLLGNVAQIYRQNIITTLLRHNTLNTEHFQRELLLLSNTKAGLGRLLNMTSFQINLPLAPQQIHANSPCIKSDRNIIFPRAGEPEQLGKTLIWPLYIQSNWGETNSKTSGGGLRKVYKMLFRECLPPL